MKCIIGNVCVMCLGDADSVYYLLIHYLFAMATFCLFRLSLVMPRIDQKFCCMLVLVPIIFVFFSFFFGEFHLLLSFALFMQ